MTLIVLAVLAGAWLVYFAVWFRESRSTSVPRLNSTQDFSRFLGALDDSNVKRSGVVLSAGTGIGASRQSEMFDTPRTAYDAGRRRRHVFAMLATAAVVSLLAVPLFGVGMVAVHLIVDLALAGFAYGALRRQHAAAEHDMNVRVLYPDRLPASEDGVVVPLRRTATG